MNVVGLLPTLQFNAIQVPRTLPSRPCFRILEDRRAHPTAPQMAAAAAHILQQYSRSGDFLCREQQTAKLLPKSTFFLLIAEFINKYVAMENTSIYSPPPCLITVIFATSVVRRRRLRRTINQNGLRPATNLLLLRRKIVLASSTYNAHSGGTQRP